MQSKLHLASRLESNWHISHTFSRMLMDVQNNLNVNVWAHCFMLLSLEGNCMVHEIVWVREMTVNMISLNVLSHPTDNDEDWICPKQTLLSFVMDTYSSQIAKKLSFQDKCGTAWNMTCLWNWLKVVLRLILKPGLTSSMLFLNKELRFFTINYVKITLFMMLSYQGKTKVRRYSFLVLGIF